MATTYTLISSNTLSSSAASVTFSSIPSTYTDLVLRVSARTDNASTGDYLTPTWNTDTATNYSNTMLYTNSGSSASSANEASVSPSTANYNTRINAANNTANTFSNNEIYIPNYTVSASKPISQFGVVENNSTGSIFLCNIASLWRNNATISQFTLNPLAGKNFVSGSSFYLYGIKNS